MLVLKQMRKAGIFRPGFIGNSMKPNIDRFIIGTSDDVLLAYIKIFRETEVNVVKKMGIENRHFKE